MARARKRLREAQRLTLVSAVFVAAGVWALSNGAVVLGVAATTFFSAGVLLGGMWWYDDIRSRRTDTDGHTGSHRVQLVLVAIASALFGLGCLAVVVLVLVGWTEVSAATAMQFSPVVVLVVGAVGTVFFLGGAVMLLVRGLR